ncbi:Protein RseC [Candidatus Erwinia haradaeae]|uniref:Protein RseC, partial n=1 Tax=Candidatus Erwinia haradaeae TaxID=1922217 RepID=A0A451DLQ3_9GAMM|nr:SoxR reducing system RseC family protein [Candidatus Erwinia haradaeae]VFP87660.1 Protein RseC [Candidatus Erwinia haradaeae]
MIKASATIASCEKHVLSLHIQKNIVCKNCSIFLDLLTPILNLSNTEKIYTIQVCDAQYILKDQQVELSINKNVILITACLIYMTPLLGLFSVGGICQMLLCNDKVTAPAALLGGAIGILITKKFSKRLTRLELFQPEVLK